MKNIFLLFWTFFKIGAFTFGGGYAMLSFIQREICEKKKWISETELLDIFTIAESTPGVIAVNTATFVGYRISGIFGGIIATVAVTLPAFIIITLLSIYGTSLLKNPIVVKIFKGIRVGVLILILNAIIKLNKIDYKKNIFSLIILLSTVFLGIFTDIGSIYILMIMIFSISIFFFIKKIKGAI